MPRAKHDGPHQHVTMIDSSVSLNTYSSSRVGRRNTLQENKFVDLFLFLFQRLIGMPNLNGGYAVSLSRHSIIPLLTRRRRLGKTNCS